MLLAAFLIGLDQLTKWWVVQQLDLGAVVQITPFFNLVHVLNPGAAFSFLASESGWQKYFLSGVAVVASIVILFMMRSSRGQKFTLFCLSCILAGAIGNLIDRNIYGAVVDFLDFYYEHYHWPAFNVADVCISVGAIGLIMDELLIKKSPKDKK
ncbi:MAG: signal peptidase II [Limnobacter sp.]|nr:signal peptidase II [Limnobacter sp.]